MTNTSPISVGALTIMAAKPRALARFYSRFLRWPYIREEEPSAPDPPEAGYALVCPPEGVTSPALNFDYQPFFQRPSWPTIAGAQTSTMHLDVAVDELDTAVAWAIKCGATLADTQPNPGGHRVVIDPEGHPICLCL